MLAEGRSWQNDEWIKYPDGRDVLLDTLKTPFFGADGQILGLIGISLDVTERIRAQERLRVSLNNLRTVVKLSSEPLIVIDARGVIEAISERGESLLGYTDGELVGRNAAPLVQFDSRVEMVLRLEDLQKHAPRPATAARRSSSGRRTRRRSCRSCTRPPEPDHGSGCALPRLSAQACRCPKSQDPRCP